MTPRSDADREQAVRLLEDAYCAWFKMRFNGVGARTVWHFFSFMHRDGDSAGQDLLPLVRRFRTECAAEGKAANWRNAIRWWLMGKEGLT